MKVIGSVSVLLAILAGLPKPTSMQTGGSVTGRSNSSVIDYSVALYLMIGIAVFYSMATLICCLLTLLNCLNNSNSRQGGKRVSPYTDIHQSSTRLDTIPEESEYSRSSSKITLPRKQALSFSKKSALIALEKEAPVIAESEMKGDFDEPAERNLSFTNKSALDLESGKVTETELMEGAGELPKRGEAITTSFKKVVPITKISKYGSEELYSGSPLMKYAPRGALVPPSEVRVPFSEAEPETKHTDTKGHRDSLPRSRPKPVSSVTDSPTRSPFHKRKHPPNEIAANDEKTDFRRKKSSVSRPIIDYHSEASEGMDSPSRSKRVGKVTPFLATTATESAALDSPIRSRPQPKHAVRSSPKHSPDWKHSPFLVNDTKDSALSRVVHSGAPVSSTTGAVDSPQPKIRHLGVVSQGDKQSTGSPVRSRPQPKHPVKSSPKHSSFLSHIAKDSAPSIVVHSKSPTISVAPDTPNSSSSTSTSKSIAIGSSTNIINADALLKELQVVKKKWYILGIQLKIPRRQLNIIQNQHRNALDKCLAILCKEWMNSSSDASWGVVVNALRSELVNEKELASTLEQHYCWIESPNSKTWL